MRQNKKAFTLIELLLSVVLMAMLLVVLYGAVYSSVRSQRSVTKQLGQLDSIQWGLELFKSDVENMRQVCTGGGGVLCKAVGTQRDNYNCRLWVNTADGAKIVDWFFVPGEQVDESFLARRISSEDGKEVAYEIIQHDVVGVEWSFYDGDTWVNVWEDNQSLPKIIKLVYKTGDSGQETHSVCIQPVIETPLINSNIGGAD